MSDLEDDDDLVDYEALGRLCSRAFLCVRVPGGEPLVRIDLATMATCATMNAGMLVVTNIRSKPFALLPGTEFSVTVETPK